MKRLIVAGLLCAACSNIPSEGDGIVALELRTPLAITLKAGESVTLKARALNSAGDSVAADIFWTTADTSISVDEQGTVTALQGTGSGRVQAATGTLRSELVSITLQPASTGGVRSD